MVAYGHEVPESKPDKLIELAKVSVEHFSAVVAPATFLVEIFPIREFTE